VTRPAGCAALCGALWGLAVAAGLAGGQAAPPAPADAYLKLTAPWPDAETMQRRQIEAETRPLFAASDPLVVTFTADFTAVNKDRDPNSTRRFPGVLAVTAADGSMASTRVSLGTRGKARLNIRTCDVVPLRVDFVEGPPKGTMFEGQESLKVVTHCRDSSAYQRYVPREYLVYRIFNLHTPASFRATLAKATYVDSSSGRTTAGRHAIFLEDPDDVARRLNGRSVDLPHVPYRDLDLDATTRLALVQYLIANTDYDVNVPHNIRIVQDQARRLIPVAYDFDVSGLVNAHYAGVDPALGIASARDRLYRGPCRTAAELEPLLAQMRAKKAEVLALYDSLPELDTGSRREARAFLEQFYTTIARPDRIRKAFIDGCGKHIAM